MRFHATYLLLIPSHTFPFSNQELTFILAFDRLVNIPISDSSAPPLPRTHAHTHTHTHPHTPTHPRSEPNKTKKNCFLTFHMSGWCQTLLLHSQKSLLFLCKREVLSRREWVIVNVLLEVLRTPEHSRWVFYGLILVGLVVKIRPWRLLAAVLGGLVAFGLVVNAVVGAVWPRGTAGPISTSALEFTRSGWFAEALRHWLVLPKNTYEVAIYQSGNYAFVTL